MSPEDRIYIAKLDAHLEHARGLLEGQQRRIAVRELTGPVPQHSLDLLENMRRAIELVQWHRALMLWKITDPTVSLRLIQPLPSTRVAPQHVLRDICSALQTTFADPSLATNERIAGAVAYAVGKAVG